MIQEQLAHLPEFLPDYRISVMSLRARDIILFQVRPLIFLKLIQGLNLKKI